MPIYDSKTKKATKDMYIKDRFITSGDNLNIIANRLLESDKLIKLLTRNGSDVLTDDRPVTDEERAEAMRTNIGVIPIIDKDIEVSDLMQSRLVGNDLSKLPKQQLSRFIL